ncbi:MAG: pyridoxamine 5'-phosphate oxidase family protein [Myxococcota bacterium]|nr:pyridoxamine 5'-phosphate oxidase family protein [Myxococcota bacterium]
MTVHAILDEALVCQIGFVIDDQPFVLPTTFVRDCERLFVHGAGANRMLSALANGVPACLVVTILDGLVLARSAFHHSMNYRSVLVLGTAREVTDRDEKLRAMALLVDKVSPGRSTQVRAPSDKEIGATAVLSLPLEEVSAKIRLGPPIDDEEDADLAVWAGVVPLALEAGALQPDCPRAERLEPPAMPWT